MSFDHLKNSFLDRWGAEDRLSRRHGPPSRSYTMPPQSNADSGSETESIAPTAIIPHSAVHLPPAAPTPPNEPVSEFQETKTQISINADHGSGQIVLSISENKQKKNRKSHQLSTSSSPGSRSASPSRHPHHRAIEAAPHGPGPVQVIEANPEPVGERAMELRSPHSPDLHAPRSPDPHSPQDGRMEMYKPAAPESPPTPPVESEPQPPPMRPRLLEGKVCAITGASRGIGRAIALGFAREGAHIIAHYWGTKSDPANEEIVSLCVDIRSLGQGCTIVFGDISDPRTSENIVRRAVETYGRLDVAVGNAGMCWVCFLPPRCCTG
jgi:hypothetical protein